MSFAYASGVITQTGADTSLAGLSGVTDVTVTTVGGKASYIIAATSRLVITGTLTIDPEIEELVALRSPTGGTAASWDAGTSVFEDIRVDGASAVLNIGARTLTNGVYKYKRGRAVYIPNGTLAFSFMCGMSNANGGTINWYSGDVVSASTIGTRTGCTMHIYSADACRFFNLRTNDSMQVRHASTNKADMVIDGLQYDGLSATYPSRLFSSYGYSSLAGVQLINGQLQQRDGVCDYMEVVGFSVKNNAASVDVSLIGSSANWSSATFAVQPVDIINCDVGASAAIDTSPSGTGTLRGVVTIWQQVDISVRDNSGAVSGCHVVIPTTDNGTRRAITGSGNADQYRSRDFTSTAFDQFSGTSDGSGVVPRMTVLNRVAGQDTTGWFEMLYNKGNDYTGNLFDAFFYSYRHLLTSQELVLASASPVTLSRLLIADSYITQTNVATVAAYTTIESLDALYDWLKYWSVQPANTAVPTRDTYLMSVDGSSLDMSGWNLVLDPAAAGPTVDTGTSTITLKSTKLDSGFNFDSFICESITFGSGAAPGSAFYATSAGSSGVLTISNLQDGSTILVVDDGGATVDYVAANSGSTYQLAFPPGSTGTWSWAAKAPGYRAASGTFDASFGGPVNAVAVQPQKLQSDGSDMYQASADSALATIEIGTSASYIDVGNGIVSAQVAFDMVERAMASEAGLRWVISGNEGITISLDIRGNTMNLTGGWLIRRRSASDANATLSAYVLSTAGTVADETNGPVKFLSVDNVTAISKAAAALIIPHIWAAS